MSLANTTEGVDPSEKNSKVKGDEDSRSKTDSTEVIDQSKSYNPEEAELGNFTTTSNTLSTETEGEMKEVKPTNQSGVSTNDNYYNNDEDGEESSQSMISFNFLYYLLQKFKLSNSLGY